MLDPLDQAQESDIKNAIASMMENMTSNGLLEVNKELESLVAKITDIFRTKFSSGPPANVPPLKIALVPEARPVRVA